MLLSTVITELCGGMITSIEIFLLTLLFSLPLGLVVAWGRMSKFKPLRWLMKVYISIMRGTPLMLQLIVVFFAQYYVFGASLSPDYRMISVIIAFSIKIVLPSITNEVITLVKDTSLSFVIAIPEMFTVAKQIAAAEASIMALLIAGVFYYIFNVIVAFVMEYIEEKLDYYD